MLIDIGANLTNKRFRHDCQQVIDAAQQAGVEKIIVTGTTEHNSGEAVSLCSSRPGSLYSTAGIHPHHASEFGPHSLERLQALAGEGCVVAIGECGLDFNRNFSPRRDQLVCFEAQLELAAETGLPVFLHQRDARQDFFRILEKYRDGLSRAVVHCFTGGADELDACMDLDLHIGITGWICDERRGMHLQELVGRIAPERLMIETDAPYLLPRDLENAPKDKRNEPRFLPHVCATVARCLGTDYHSVAHATTATALGFFGLGVPEDKLENEPGVQ